MSGIDPESVRVCPASDPPELPDFSSAVCETQRIVDVDPQGQMIWARFTLRIPDEFITRRQPTGLFVSGAMATHAFLNGHDLGQNGHPGINRASERPGQMDTVFFVPPDAMRAGDNQLVLLMSSHHCAIALRNPIHFVGLGRYARAQDGILGSYAPSLIPLGIFVLGLLVFGFRSLGRDDRETSLLVFFTCLFVGLQLMAEVARGLTAYTYPFHVTRLLLILSGAAGFGLMLFAYALKRFFPDPARLRWLIWAAASAIVLATVFLVSGFDTKTAFALLLPLLATSGVSAWAARKRRSGAILLAALTGLAAITLFWRPDLMLDRGIFFVGGVLVIWLLIEQAAALLRARRAVLEERGKRERLELALEQAREKEAPTEIQLTASGKIRRIRADTIVRLCAAGDYTELTTRDGRTELFTVSLSELESRLPKTFLRVHRSHIVNTAFVTGLTREASGVGELALSTTDRIPVSRRIMPKVRSALSQ